MSSYIPGGKFLTVYVLHFTPPHGRFQHYIGITKSGRLDKRIHEHLAGRGAALVRRAVDAGCEVWLGHSFLTADPSDERKLKDRHGARAVCSICRPGLRRDHPPRKFEAVAINRGPDFDPELKLVAWESHSAL